MKRPLVAASFFSFPRLLLCSLPLGSLLAYTWLFGGRNVHIGWLISQTEDMIATKVCPYQEKNAVYIVLD